ncbi:hypothetical protein F652_2727 [Enterobacteriaceae bacterium bta3-1]|nr:hypothetical protein F652_2727 [Enterobacteriaceae bacterium bta3-1]
MFTLSFSKGIKLDQLRKHNLWVSRETEPTYQHVFLLVS